MGGHVFQEDVFLDYRDDMSYSCRRTCISGGRVLLEDIFYGRTCLTGGLFKYIIHSYIYLPISLCKCPSMHLVYRL